MGRPRGTGKNTAMVNGRITSEQMDWLLERAEELGGNLSAALRETITHAQFLKMARDSYDLLRAEHPEFEIPRHDDDGGPRILEQLLAARSLMDSDDARLREQGL